MHRSPLGKLQRRIGEGGQIALLSLALLFAGCGDQGAGPDRIVQVHVIPASLPEGSSVFITGNQPALGDWGADFIELEPASDGTWRRTFSFPEGTHLEFRITRGSWDTEGVDEYGVESPNYVVDVKSDTLVALFVARWKDIVGGEPAVSIGRFRDNGGIIELVAGWRYHSGDNLEWADQLFDDSDWQVTTSRMAPDDALSEQWEGMGWFRLRFRVDSTLWHVPLGLLIRQAGASEVYLNGQFLHSFGTVASDADHEKSYLERYPIVFVFKDLDEQVLAVRYSNSDIEHFLDQGVTAGFRCILVENPDVLVNARSKEIRSFSVYQMVFTTTPLALALLHFLLFFYYPRARENLFYALCMISWGAFVFSDFQRTFAVNLSEFIAYTRILGHLVTLAVLFGLMTAYTIVYDRIPRYFLVFLGIGLVVTLASFISISDVVSDAPYLLAGAAMLELIRIFFIAGIRRKKVRWITGVGFIGLTVFLGYQIMIEAGVIEPLGGIGIVYVYGVALLSIAVSIDLSRSYALISRNLERQLVQVKDLSARMLEQERQAKEEELSRRLLEADNQRKTQELLEARKLQLSMLPGEVPDHPNLDIAVYMKPATEVGGDYYDFSVAEDGTLTVVVGDATGHGARAGTMVTVTKSLFQELSVEKDIVQIFEKYTRAIKSLNLGNLFMAMTLVRIKDNTMVASSAGMPPILIYRAASGSVEEITMKGMPLGSFHDFPYKSTTIDLKSGDCVVLMSDGFPEVFNKRKELLDYPRAGQIVNKVGNESPQEIIRHLIRSADEWSEGQPHSDDITFVVLKVRSNGSTPSRKES